LSGSGVAVLGFLSEFSIVVSSEFGGCGCFVPIFSSNCSDFIKAVDFSAGLGSVSKGQTHFSFFRDLKRVSPEFYSIKAKVGGAQNSKLLALPWPRIEQGSGQLGV
jgi:hypothetical protein